jgi:hypothetical protein
MATVGRALIEFLAKGAGQVKGQADKVKNSLKDVKDSGSAAGEAVDGIGKAVQAMGAAGIVAGAARLGGEIATIGMEAERTRNTLNALSGGEADTYIADIQEATNGLVSEMDAASAASMFLSMGLASTSEEAAEMARIATILGGTFKDLGAGDAAAELAVMLSNMSTARLDSFGISSGQVKDRIKELMETVPGMTREMAFLQATMEIGGESADMLSGNLSDTASEFERLQTTVQDFKTDIGLAVVDGIAPMITTGVDLVKTLGEQSEQMLLGAESASDYEDALLASSDAMRAAAINQRALQIQQELGIGKGKALGIAMNEWVQGLDVFSENAFEAAEAQRRLNESLEAAALIEDFAPEMEKYAQSLGLVADAQTDVTATVEEATAAYQQVMQDIAAYNAALQMQAAIQLSLVQQMPEFLNSMGGLADAFAIGTGQLQNHNLSAAEMNQLYQELGLATGQLTMAQIDAATAVRQLSNLWVEGKITAAEYAESLALIQEGAEASGVALETMSQAAIEMSGVDPFAAFADGDIIAADAAAIGEAYSAAFAEISTAAEGMTEVASMEELQSQVAELSATIESLPSGSIDLEFATNAAAALEEVSELTLSVDDVASAVSAVPMITTGAANESADVTQLGADIASLTDWEITVTVHVDYPDGVPPQGGGSGGGGKGGGGAKQHGTTALPGGGATLVGETGPELAVLPQGTRIIPSPRSRAMLNGGGGGGQTVVNHNTFYIRADSFEEIQQEARSRGVQFMEIE